MQKNFSVKGFGIIKGALLSVIVACVLILVFAFVLKFTLLGNNAIKVINQFIKSVAIFFGCFFCLREGFALIKGALLGGVFALIINILFALFGKTDVNFGTLILDLLFCALIGGILGVTCVNLSKNK